jgi:alginate O-acetyltransferase complex protein AlgI
VEGGGEPSGQPTLARTAGRAARVCGAGGRVRGEAEAKVPFTRPFFLFCFLPATLLLYTAAPRRLKNATLTVLSLVFYAAGEWRFLGWLVASVAVNYWIGRGLEATRGRPWSRRLLIIGVTSDLSLLLVFKYYGFAMENVNAARGWFGAAPVHYTHLLLPLGISFFTFHKISYKVDVYRGLAEARKAPLDLALYILVFPQLIAGPIVRYREIAHEVVSRAMTRADFAAGARRFVLGLGKKMIVANTMATCADGVFAVPTDQLTTGLAWLGVVSYALQIYFDFSGYSDMAIGMARLFGFHFPENFNYPYLSGSITEFWRRWHMSLSRWFRDYVYIPLGGNRRSPARTYLNLVIVFFLCGLWHGASWTFVTWGMLHGALLVVERLGWLRTLARLPRPVRHGYALLMVLVGWAFFRADTVGQALGMVGAMAGFARGDGLMQNARVYVNAEVVLAFAVGAIGSVPALAWGRQAWRWLAARAGVRVAPVFEFAHLGAEMAAVVSIFVYSSMLVAAGSYNPFLYFRF